MGEDKAIKRTEKEEAYEYWLARIWGIRSGKKYLLHRRMKTAEAVYYIEETHLRKMEFLNEREQNTIMQAKKQEDFKEDYERICEKGIRFIPWNRPEYPNSLAEISDFPYALYVKGNLPDADRKSAAIVGARRCTPYGERYAVDFGRALAEYGVNVISGMARGIDGMGHRGALLGRGRTYAVLGSGVDICYPREHLGLYVDILEQGGGILSEQPPGTAPLPRNFPARNRIISGLSDAVLVMEAGRKSGSLITVDMALEQGRDVYALPGPVNSELSNGCNRLIHQGAEILLSPEQLLNEWGMAEKRRDQKETDNAKIEKVLESKEKLVYSCLGLYPKGIDCIVTETALENRAVMELLVSLQLRGYVREVSKNQYIRS